MHVQLKNEDRGLQRLQKSVVLEALRLFLFSVILVTTIQKNKQENFNQTMIHLISVTIMQHVLKTDKHL